MAFRLFRKEKRLPTLVGIFILLLGIAATSYLIQHLRQNFLKAEPLSIPQMVKISNISHAAFTVSWVTPENPSSGYLRFGQSRSLGEIGLDERDQEIEELGKHTLHYVTLNNLKPLTTYYFKIISQGKEYGENDAPYSVTTAEVNYSSFSFGPTYGVILEENGKPAKEGIVYVRAGNSNLTSTLVKSSGNWLVSLSSLMSEDLKGSLNLREEDFEEIFVQGDGKTSKVIVSLEGNAPVPDIILGKDYDFRTLPSPSPALPKTTPPEIAPDFFLIQPASEAAIPGQPFFRGTGIPGKQVEIKVESETSLTGTVTIDQGGTWTWQPPEDLTPGSHTVTVTSVNSQGKLQAIVRKFIVLASGSQVVEAATPSATPTSTLTPQPSPLTTPTTSPGPTPTPTPTSSLTPAPTPRLTSTPTPTPSLRITPSLTLSPTPQATTTPPPESGDLLLTLILAGAGIFFLALSFFFFKSPTL